jgi:hypothetical protein
MYALFRLAAERRNTFRLRPSPRRSRRAHAIGKTAIDVETQSGVRCGLPRLDQHLIAHSGEFIAEKTSKYLIQPVEWHLGLRLAGYWI